MDLTYTFVDYAIKINNEIGEKKLNKLCVFDIQLIPLVEHRSL